MNKPLNKPDPGLSTADFVAGAEGPNQQEMHHPDPGGIGATQNVGGAQMVREEKPAPLFDDHEAQDLRSRWSEIQTGFVDEPRKAVEQADNLVAQTMKRLAEIFANEREGLEKQWDRGDNISTEDFRVALQRYRSFFNRLLSM